MNKYFNPEKVSVKELAEEFKNASKRKKHILFMEVVDYIHNALGIKQLSIEALERNEGRQLLPYLKAVTFPYNHLNSGLVKVINKAYSDLKNKKVKYRKSAFYSLPIRFYERHDFPAIIPITVYGEPFYIYYGNKPFSEEAKEFLYTDDVGAFVLYYDKNKFVGVEAKDFNAKSAIQRAIELYAEIQRGIKVKYDIVKGSDDVNCNKRSSVLEESELNTLSPLNIGGRLEINDEMVEVLAYRYILEGLQYEEPAEWHDRLQKIYDTTHARLTDTFDAYVLYDMVKDPLSLEEENNLLNMQYSVEDLKHSRLKYFTASPEFLYKFIDYYAKANSLPFLTSEYLDPVNDELFFDYFRFFLHDSSLTNKEILDEIMKVQLKFNINFIQSLNLQSAVEVDHDLL